MGGISGRGWNGISGRIRVLSGEERRIVTEDLGEGTDEIY